MTAIKAPFGRLSERFCRLFVFAPRTMMSRPAPIVRCFFGVLVERFSKSFTKFMVHLYPRVFYKLDEGDYEVQAIGVAPRRAKKINRAE